jgi:hypothetical protein
LSSFAWPEHDTLLLVDFAAPLPHKPLLLIDFAPLFVDFAASLPHKTPLLVDFAAPLLRVFVPVLRARRLVLSAHLLLKAAA